MSSNLETAGDNKSWVGMVMNGFVILVYLLVKTLAPHNP